MKILRRTKGIDLKAKNSILRGDVTIQLRDAITGKVKFEEKGHNMLTNGLASALNGCPWDMNKVDGCYDSIIGTKFPTTPIFSQLLGGVILFPSALGNDPDLLFPSFSNTPTAYSSVESYQQTDSKQGTFDSVSSGEIANGIRFVHTWGSAYGNGTISSLGLAPRNAHVWCKDVPSMIKPNNGFAGGFYAQGYCHGTARIVYAMNKDYVIVGDGSWNPVMRCFKNTTPNVNIKLPYTGSDLFTVDTYTIDGVDIDGCLWTNNNMGITYFEGYNMQIIGNYVYTIVPSGSSITVKKFDITDGTLVSTDTYTYAVTFGSRSACIYDGYLYCVKNGGGAIYKCNMSNTADVTEIADASIESDCHIWNIGTNFLYTWDGILDGDTGVFVPFTSATKFYKAPNHTFYPLWDNGMWIVGYAYANGSIGATMKQWGLMTHYDLQSPVTKTADKQMIVNYSVTQV